MVGILVTSESRWSIRQLTEVIIPHLFSTEGRHLFTPYDWREYGLSSVELSIRGGIEPPYLPLLKRDLMPRRLFVILQLLSLVTNICLTTSWLTPFLNAITRKTNIWESRIPEKSSPRLAHRLLLRFHWLPLSQIFVSKVVLAFKKAPTTTW